MQRRVQKYFVDVSPKQLRDSFAVTLTSERSMGDAYRLDLVPKRKQISEGVTRIQIWIDRGSLMMTKMALSFAGGDAKTLELRDIKINPRDRRERVRAAGPRRPLIDRAGRAYSSA